ncbi:hypothetical protein ACTHR6_25000 [Ralstonia holmesii]|uniref:hypothetical protein n=1 Tax=Ralstonia TaxID=48736 RepID=UPI0004699D86|nr:hypothetical protein [Ralstonia pickettii]
MTAATKIGMKTIVVTRAEGPFGACGRSEKCSTFEQANGVLRAWSATAPANGGYDKCDFMIEFDDGFIYKGRYDLYHGSVKTADVGEHVRSLALFYTGRVTPDHMTQESHLAFLRKRGAEACESYQHLIDNYEIGCEAIPASLL